MTRLEQRGAVAFTGMGAAVTMIFGLAGCAHPVVGHLAIRDISPMRQESLPRVMCCRHWNSITHLRGS
jgi:hypothetical protein